MIKKIFLAVLISLTAAITAFAGGELSYAEPIGYGVVRLSVCNMRSTPDFDAEMISQAILGTPVHILAVNPSNGWVEIQTPDLYRGWVHHMGVEKLSFEEYHRWNQDEKAVVTDLFGIVYEKKSDKSATVSDVVAGDRLRYLGRSGCWTKVGYPDGREGYLRSSAVAKESKWRKNLKQDIPSILETSKLFMGFPYIWAGMSPKGVDCSGFVRTVLYMHDIIIPRDASQQAPKGLRIDIDKSDFSNLEPGDLLFFGRWREDGSASVGHVALYLGDNRYIHSVGIVKTSSFDPSEPDYDEYNLGRLLFASRILPYINLQDGLNTSLTNPFYNE